MRVPICRECPVSKTCESLKFSVSDSCQVVVFPTNSKSVPVKLKRSQSSLFMTIFYYLLRIVSTVLLYR